ncbi:MAG: hypothetical protein J1G30_04920 [Spirochaetales bacterium]|nr:hypothetical protein [Spirochaetales bacterium]
MLEKINIKSMGPISNREFILKQNNLIVGNNESGKTSIVDALEKHLLRERKKSDINLLSRLSGFNENRFGGNWEFEIIGDCCLDQMHSDTNFANIVNLLVVREAGNKLTDRDNKDATFSDFWKNSVRTLLGGIDKSTDRIEKLKKYLVTSSGPWKIIETLEQYQNRLIEEKRRLANSDLSNEEIENSENQLKEKKERLEILSKIEKANEYAETEQKFSKLIKLTESIKELRNYIAENDIEQLEAIRDDWKERNKKKSDYEKQRAEHEKALIDEKNEIQKNISNRESERKILQDSAKRLSDKRNELHNRSIRLENEMENEQTKTEEKLKSLNIEKEKLAAKYNFSKMSVIPIILFFIGVFSFTLVKSNQHILPGSIMLILFSIGWGIKDFINFNHRKNDKMRKIDKIKENIEKLKDDLDRIEDKLEMSEQTVNENISTAEREIKELQDKIDGINREIDKKREELEEINVRYSTEMQNFLDLISENQAKLDNYFLNFGDQAKLGGKIFEYHSKEQDLEEENAELEELSAELKDIFDIDEILISRIEHKLAMMKKNIDKSYIDMEYNPDERERLISEINKLKEEKYDRSNEISGVRSEIVGRLTKDFSNISSPVKWGDKFFNRYFLPLIVDLKVTNVYELDRAIKRTEDAIQTVKRYKKYAEKMSERIREIENNQIMLASSIIQSPNFKEKIRSISGYDVGDIIQNNDRFEITFHKDENTYYIENLSTGALNQFYFSLRVALAQRILTRPGIFILDDAFIHFDREKRKRSFELLKSLTDKGWQFVYTGVADGELPHLYKEVFNDEANIISL